MKTVITILLISFCCNINAQKTMFVRVYDLKGKIMYRAEIYSVTDSSLSLIVKKQTLQIPVTGIGLIRTKRSAGHNVLIGSAGGAGIGAIFGLASSDPNNEIIPISAAEGAAAGAMLGAFVGAAVGGITGVLKKKEIFFINGDYTRWLAFKSFVLEKGD